MAESQPLSIRPKGLEDVELQVTCERLVLRHYLNIDAGKATSSLELFSDDAALTARGRTARGHQEIGDMLRGREEQRDRITHHVLTNFDLLQSEHALLATGLLTVYARDAASHPEKVTRYSASFVLRDGVCLISELASDEDRAVKS